MTQIQAIKPILVSNKEMRYDFTKELIQDIDNENHINVLLSTNKFKLIK